MKIEVLVFTLTFREHLITHQVLGDRWDSDRYIDVTYPSIFELPPCEEQDWCSVTALCFTKAELIAYSMSRGSIFQNDANNHVHGKSITISGYADQLPSLGNLKVNLITREIDI